MAIRIIVSLSGPDSVCYQGGREKPLYEIAGGTEVEADEFHTRHNQSSAIRQSDNDAVGLSVSQMPGVVVQR